MRGACPSRVTHVSRFIRQPRLMGVDQAMVALGEALGSRVGSSCCGLKRLQIKDWAAACPTPSPTCPLCCPWCACEALEELSLRGCLDRDRASVSLKEWLLRAQDVHLSAFTSCQTRANVLNALSFRGVTPRLQVLGLRWLAGGPGTHRVVHQPASSKGPDWIWES